jgi:hypothetical protein
MVSGLEYTAPPRCPPGPLPPPIVHYHRVRPHCQHLRDTPAAAAPRSSTARPVRSALRYTASQSPKPRRYRRHRRRLHPPALLILALSIMMLLSTLIMRGRHPSLPLPLPLCRSRSIRHQPLSWPLQVRLRLRTGILHRHRHLQHGRHGRHNRDRLIGQHALLSLYLPWRGIARIGRIGRAWVGCSCRCGIL